MIVRNPGKENLGQALGLARDLGLGYPGMEADKLWIAEDEGRIVGVVALRSHPDCLELCSLGVDPGHRNRGLGRALVEAVMKHAPGDVHLGTVIPGYFERLGFHITAAVPKSFLKKRASGWCEDCDVEQCAVMVGNGT